MHINIKPMTASCYLSANVTFVWPVNNVHRSVFSWQLKLMGVFQVLCGGLTLLLFGFNACSGLKICRCTRKTTGSQRSSEITVCSDTPYRSMNAWIPAVHFQRGYILPRLELSKNQNRNPTKELHLQDRTDLSRPMRADCTDKFWIGSVLTQEHLQEDPRLQAQIQTISLNRCEISASRLLNRRRIVGPRKGKRRRRKEHALSSPI